MQTGCTGSSVGRDGFSRDRRQGLAQFLWTSRGDHHLGAAHGEPPILHHQEGPIGPVPAQLGQRQLRPRFLTEGRPLVRLPPHRRVALRGGMRASRQITGGSSAVHRRGADTSDRVSRFLRDLPEGHWHPLVQADRLRPFPASTGRVVGCGGLSRLLGQSEVRPDRMPGARITRRPVPGRQLCHSGQPATVLSQSWYGVWRPGEVRNRTPAQVIDHDARHVRTAQHLHHEEPPRLPRARVPQAVADELGRHPLRIPSRPVSASNQPTMRRAGAD